MARHDEGFFSATDNLRLFFESVTPDDPRAHVGLVHGYADHCGRYRQTVAALAEQGLAVHAFDYRGHGQADGRRGHCDAFGEYVDDLEQFWQRVRSAAGGKKAFLLAHSMGALIAVHFLRRGAEGLSGVILSSPFLQLAMDVPATKLLAAKVVGSVVPWLPMDLGLKSADLTRDPEEQRRVERDPLYNRKGTPRWFSECTRAQEQARAMGSSIASPLLLIFGSDDPIVSTSAIRAFFSTVGSTDKSLTEYPGMRHECLNELGKEQVWKDISNWISAHL